MGGAGRVEHTNNGKHLGNDRHDNRPGRTASDFTASSSPFENAAAQFDRQYGNTVAMLLRAALTQDLLDLNKRQNTEESEQARENREKRSNENQSAQNKTNKDLPDTAKYSQTEKQNNSAKPPENSRPAQNPHSAENSRPQTENTSAHIQNNSPMNELNQPKNQNILKQPATTPQQSGQATRPAPHEDLHQLVNKTLNSLINTAKEQTAFNEFKNKPDKFWDNVRQMSEIRIVEKYVNGAFIPQAVSRYGELLEKLNRQGGNLETFLNCLPKTERDVFLARYQLSKIFGANELFVGNGVMLGRDGTFSVRVFMSNGRNIDLPLNMILSLTGGGLPLDDIPNLLFLANPSLVFDVKTAALLGLSLSLYQNIGSQIPLNSLLPEMFTPNLQKAGENAAMKYVEMLPESNSVKGNSRVNEYLIPVALINGAMQTVEDIEEFDSFSVEDREARFSIYYSGFSAGATGAMLGAIVGTLASFEETSVGSALGFAASVVTGTAERGLRALSVNLLISDVVTSGVQTLLTAAPSLLLPEGDLSQNISADEFFDAHIPAMSV